MIKTIYNIMNRLAILNIYLTAPILNIKLLTWLFPYDNINKGLFVGIQLALFILFYVLYLSGLHYLEKRIKND